MDKFQQVVRLAPDNAEAHFSLGVIYESQHHYKEALASYSQRAAEINPQKREYKEAVAIVQKKAKGEEEDPREAANKLAGSRSFRRLYAGRIYVGPRTL